MLCGDPGRMEAATPSQREQKENYVCERHGQRGEDSLKSVSFCFGRRFNIVEFYTCGEMGTVCQYSFGRTEITQVLLNMYTMCMQIEHSVYSVIVFIVPVGKTSS